MIFDFELLSAKLVSAKIADDREALFPFIDYIKALKGGNGLAEIALAPTVVGFELAIAQTYRGLVTSGRRGTPVPNSFYTKLALVPPCVDMEGVIL